MFALLGFSICLIIRSVQMIYTLYNIVLAYITVFLFCFVWAFHFCVSFIPNKMFFVLFMLTDSNYAALPLWRYGFFVGWAGFRSFTNQHTVFATWRRNSPPTLGLSTLIDRLLITMATLLPALNSRGHRNAVSGNTILTSK